MTEDRVPTTEAGRELAAQLHGDEPGGTPHGREVEDAILAIEAEAREQPAPPLDVLPFISAYFDTVDGDGTPAEVYAAEQNMRKAWERAVNPALRSEQPASPLGRADATRLAVEILRFTGGCEKPHRNGERNPHVHIETTHRWGQRLAAIAREQPAPPPDVERLAEALVRLGSEAP